MKEEKYDSEDLLQKLLENYPKILAGDQINSENPRKWLLISREMGVPDDENASDRWSVDHLFIDQEAIPTFVEVKRSTDTRIRREVVAQMLDYAANGVEYWKIPEIKVQFEQRCSENGTNPSDVVQQALGLEVEYEKIWTLVESNLKNRKLRLLFVSDEIPKELKRIVEFLNEQMKDVEVLAVEVKQFNGENLKTLVPRVIGQTSQAEQIKNPGQKRQWDEQSFMDDLPKKVSPEDVSVVKKLLAWTHKNKFRIWWGQGSQNGSCYPIIDLPNSSHQFFSLWTNGKIEIEFQWMRRYPQFADPEKLLTFLRMLNAIPGVRIAEEAVKGRPSFSVSVLRDEKNYSRFIDAVEWLLQEIRAN